MASNSATDGTMPKPETELVLRDLKALLRESFGDEVIVVKYATEKLLPKGENYGSTLLKVDSVIKRTKNSSEENLPFVAKMIPTSEFQQTIFNSTISLNKETFVYKKLIPAFRKLEKEVGVKDEDLIDITPKYIGGRLSRNKDRLDVADEDAVMLMDNLKERGYYTLNRKKGLDLDHAKLAIKELAHFHALSMALKIKESEFFEEAKKLINESIFDMKDFEELLEHTVADVCEDPRIGKYKDRIRASIDASKDWDVVFKAMPEEPWVAIIHGDFWVNNMLFRQENGQVKDTKFVDFQITRVNSPMKDLPYVLLTSVGTDVINNYFEELLDIYYNKLIDVLMKNGCDVSPFTRKSFDEQLGKDANTDLFHCLMSAKFFTQDVNEDYDHNDMVNSLMINKANNLYLERCWLIVSKFVEKGWI